MKSQSATDILAHDILLLEVKRDRQFEILKDNAHASLESLRPINLIKSTLHEVADSPDVKHGALKVGIGMASGFLLKKLLFGFSGGPINKLVGGVFQTLATTVATKNSDKIIEGGTDIFEMGKDFIMSKIKGKKEKQIS